MKKQNLYQLRPMAGAEEWSFVQEVPAAADYTPASPAGDAEAYTYGQNTDEALEVALCMLRDERQDFRAQLAEMEELKDEFKSSADHHRRMREAAEEESRTYKAYKARPLPLVATGVDKINAIKALRAISYRDEEGKCALGLREAKEAVEVLMSLVDGSWHFTDEVKLAALRETILLLNHNLT